MTGPPAAPGEQAARRALETALAGGADASLTRSLAALEEPALDRALAAFAADRAAASLPVLTALAAASAPRPVRRAARRALYRLSQRGIAAAPPPAARPVVARQPERALRAWISGIDGSGARACWILFEGPWGGWRLCSLILNDVTGIADVAGGDITKKRLDRELATLRASQKLPWVAIEPARAVALVAEALALHARLGTTPPAGFERWRQLFEGADPAAAAPPAASADPALAERGGELLERPELAGWFLDPERVQPDAVDLLQARESRLVVSDQVKAEREETIVGRVVERELGDEARRLWARRLLEMALLLEADQAGEPAAGARAAATALADPGREARAQPFARGLARRALEVASEVALGRLSAADVRRRAPSPPPTALA
ncbi:MAG: hypothetical protein HY294_03810 [Candidatus Rokubacteria bacterium]|nr:hypothetical protein [Candidatus Rokubacteria bacterium]